MENFRQKALKIVQVFGSSIACLACLSQILVGLQHVGSIVLVRLICEIYDL